MDLGDAEHTEACDDVSSLFTVPHGWEVSTVPQADMDAFYHMYVPSSGTNFPKLSEVRAHVTLDPSPEIRTPSPEVVNAVSPMTTNPQGKFKGWQGPGPGRKRGETRIAVIETLDKSLQVGILFRLLQCVQLERDHAMFISRFDLSSQCERVLERFQQEEDALLDCVPAKESLWIIDGMLWTIAFLVKLNSKVDVILLTMCTGCSASATTATFTCSLCTWSEFQDHEMCSHNRQLDDAIKRISDMTPGTLPFVKSVLFDMYRYKFSRFSGNVFVVTDVVGPQFAVMSMTTVVQRGTTVLTGLFAGEGK